MNKFYIGDVRTIHIDKKADLFISHPPYLGEDTNRYGDKDGKQINYNQDLDTYVKALVDSTINIGRNLNYGGSIFMIIPIVKYPTLPFKYMSEMMKNSTLKINNTIIWDWDDGKILTPGTKYCFIFHFSKGDAYIRRVDDFKSIISIPWFDQFSDELPKELAKELILLYSREGDLVGDLFGGTGTVQQAALETNRDFVYNDISRDQLEIARKRLSKWVTE